MTTQVECTRTHFDLYQIFKRTYTHLSSTDTLPTKITESLLTRLKYDSTRCYEDLNADFMVGFTLLFLLSVTVSYSFVFILAWLLWHYTLFKRLHTRLSESIDAFLSYHSELSEVIKHIKYLELHC